MVHHISTLMIMVASYVVNLTRVKCLLMVLMDCSDIFIPVSGP